MIAYKGKGVSGGYYKGKKMKEAWMSGHKVWPKEELFDGMILNVSIPEDNFEVVLGDYVDGVTGEVATIIFGEWNTYTISGPTTSTISYRYGKAGDYQIKISGKIKWKGKPQYSAESSLSKCLTSIKLPTNNSPIIDIGEDGFRYFTKLTTIPAGLFNKCTALTSFSFCFYNCTSLQSIPKRLFDNNTLVTRFDDCFNNCKSLQSIPEGLFDNNTLVTNFYYCFSSCTSLQAIPKGLFDNCIAVKDFNYCFYNCTSLQSIPDGLFDNNTAVTSFSHCFSGCSSLQAIPERLFANNTKATIFQYCFYNCRGLQSIPKGLFDNNTLVGSFISCFQGCSSITSNLPELWISHPSASHIRCFNNCDKAPNYPEAYAAGWADSPAVSLTLNTLQDNQLIDLSPYIKPINDNSIDIEWGDNSMETIDTNNVQHTYANKGEYVVDIYGDVEWNDKQSLKSKSMAITLNPIKAESIPIEQS